ncbi:hypothetical protein [Weissella minor]|uniref:hypothetical protein n=1 Tax=Weissella minor TaxID=1620 RepID=UPI003AF2D14A
MDKEQLIEFAFVTPRGLEVNDDGIVITRVGKLSSSLDINVLKINDLLAVSTHNEPFRLGVLTNFDIRNAIVKETEYAFMKPNQEDALIGFVKRLALQTGRTKAMRK